VRRNDGNMLSGKNKLLFKNYSKGTWNTMNAKFMRSVYHSSFERTEEIYHFLDKIEQYSLKVWGDSLIQYQKHEEPFSLYEHWH
jgi:hypothetical protein